MSSSIFYILMETFPSKRQTTPLFFCTTQIDNLLSNLKNLLFFHMDQFTEQKVEQKQFLDISWDYSRLTVALFYVVSMTTVWVRPPIKPTSAVISSPKSFVIALICIPQLSVLAHSKNNQPPLKTGNSIIIISVDLYKISLKSLCLRSALHWLDLPFIFINIHISVSDR